jgi:hypothetical protein
VQIREAFKPAQQPATNTATIVRNNQQRAHQTRRWSQPSRQPSNQPSCCLQEGTAVNSHGTTQQTAFDETFWPAQQSAFFAAYATLF